MTSTESRIPSAISRLPCARLAESAPAPSALRALFAPTDDSSDVLDSPTDFSQPQIIALPKILDSRGNLSFIQPVDSIPFEIERVYWIYDVPGGEHRGGHAFHNTDEMVIALSGSFDVVLHDGNVETRFALNRSYHGLFVPRMIWRRLENFSTNSLALILASTHYHETDYIRDFADFRRLRCSRQCI